MFNSLITPNFFCAFLVYRVHYESNARFLGKVDLLTGPVQMVKFFKILSPCTNTLAEVCLPRLEGTLEVVFNRNVSRECCNMLLGVFQDLPTLSFQRSLQSGKQTSYGAKPGL